MMTAVEASGAYSGHTTFIGEEGASKGKLVSNCSTLRGLGWYPTYGARSRRRRAASRPRLSASLRSCFGAC